MAISQREEVLNTVFAAAIVARGINASPETIHRGGSEKPDVLIAFRGLRCAIEGKVADVPSAREIVTKDAMRRVEGGLVQLAIAVVYPKHLRTISFGELSSALATARFDFSICSEPGVGEWQDGSIEAILDALRRMHDTLATDDVVRKAADELTVGLQEVANLFMTDTAVCDRLIDLLGIGERESRSDAASAD